MFNRKKAIIEKDKKTQEYTFNVSDSDLPEFYEQLVKFLFKDGNPQKLDNFLQVSENRINEYLNQIFYWDED